MKRNCNNFFERNTYENTLKARRQGNFTSRGQKRKGLFNPFQNFDDVVNIMGSAFPFNSVWFFIIE